MPEEHSFCHANKNGHLSHPLENDLGEGLGMIWKTVTTSEKISSYARACIDVFQLNSF